MISFGLGIGRTGANSARPTTKTSHPIASQAPMPKRRRGVTPAETARTSAGTATSVGRSGGMTHPRVEHAVEQVDDKVHDDVAAPDQRDTRLHRDVLALRDRLEDRQTNPG